MAEVHTAFVSVGSNLGDKLENCQRGVASLTRHGCEVIAQSGIYRTEPVDYLDQDWFVNYVIQIETRLEPLQLLDAIQKIQLESGRGPDKIRFGPRILDLDIIFYDTITINTSQLIIPHPRMHKRRFVLQPLCDIDPTLIHPVLNVGMLSLLQALDDDEQRIHPYR
ncbi:MAG: 2-amino-4-hydroxy-6-hydroxymethyldihydropteridine diphosphokinase [Deltaproteobacteria bacterium]|jgi:2-amino-4-hydroxy-6-hydroxymethyldihydropteridine diphosphokinase|nr:2-amino-4-hydroxy-6-hydroxymethyldihydropteridine diphosphokinase [Deltaproteobacteria bacterium]